MGTIYIPHIGNSVPPPSLFAYDTYAASLSLQHRWRLNSTPSLGSTEASVGTSSTNLVCGVNGGVVTSGVTDGTADAAGHQYTMTAKLLYAEIAGGIPATFTTGLWYRPSALRSTATQHLFSIGNNATNAGYIGCWVSISNGDMNVQFGDGLGFVDSGHRKSYQTTAPVGLSYNTPTLVVLRCTKVTAVGAISFELFVNGTQVSCPLIANLYTRGDATTVAWGNWIKFGNAWEGTTAESMGDPMDEPFFTTGYLTTPQILQLYQYGSTP